MKTTDSDGRMKMNVWDDMQIKAALISQRVAVGFIVGARGDRVRSRSDEGARHVI
ncbi:MAG TPA: hypothetical protein VFW59_08995 [Gallionella sp.]|nr:hypothetical protein [Gallionella sp.]